MAEKLTFRYDADLDILTIGRRPPYLGQETEELGEDVIARLNPRTREIESLEVLCWLSRLREGTVLELPVTVELHPAAG